MGNSRENGRKRERESRGEREKNNKTGEREGEKERRHISYKVCVDKDLDFV